MECGVNIKHMFTLHDTYLVYISDEFLPTVLFSKSDVEGLNKEVSMMLSFHHPNVMPLIGVCMDREMPLLIMPFMNNGSVLEYVKNHKKELFMSSEAKEENVCPISI